MSISNIVDPEEEPIYLKKEVIEFTDSDKTDLLQNLSIMIKSHGNKESSLVTEWNALVFELQSFPPSKILEYLANYLKVPELFDISKTKSFIFLKLLLVDEITEETRLLQKKLASHTVLKFLHIIFYKVFPCMNGNHCKHYPRKIVHKNDFTDNELDCFFYHHEKDQRRFVLNDGEKEFKYAGNFADSKKGSPPNIKQDFSQNFFESLYHPLYYKNFSCVRTKCEKSIFCPYYHSNEEKAAWGVFFKDFFSKDREIFTKKRNAEEDSRISKPHNKKQSHSNRTSRTNV